MFDTFQKLLSDFFIFRRFSVDAVAIIFVGSRGDRKQISLTLLLLI